MPDIWSVPVAFVTQELTLTPAIAVCPRANRKSAPARNRNKGFRSLVRIVGSCRNVSIQERDATGDEKSEAYNLT
jgi:hypothetical protein